MSDRAVAELEFRRMMKWIVLIGVVMAVGAVAYEAALGPLYVHMVVATLLGVFLSMVVGCGLFALAFFSHKSGHDDIVRDATGPQDCGEDKA